MKPDGDIGEEGVKGKDHCGIINRICIHIHDLLKQKEERTIIEKIFELLLHKIRWMLSPLYLGLILGLILLVIVFFRKFILVSSELFFGAHALFSDEFDFNNFVYNLFELIDVALIGNLLLMVIIFGYNHFVSEIDPLKEKNVKDKHSWMQEVNYSNIKLKVIGSIVVISAIQLLAVFFKISEVVDHGQNKNEHFIIFLIVLHFTFVLSGAVFSYTEYMQTKIDKKKPKSEEREAE